MSRARSRSTGGLAALGALLTGCLAAGCSTPSRIPDESAIERLARAVDAGLTVRYRAEDLDAREAGVLARRLAEVRDSVAKELALDPTKPDKAPPAAEVVLYRDTGWGQDRWLVTHAVIMERPLRVRIPCGISADEHDGERIAARLRGTVAHEIAEATVLTRVPVLDPYLRWMHDGIAESVEYRVLCALDPAAAAATIDRYALYSKEARAAGARWVDLTRWRQLSDWILHSDALFADHRPLWLDDLPGALHRVADERFAVQEQHPESLWTLDQVTRLVSEAWLKEQLPIARGEADPRPRAGQFLFYDASFCLWLELETAHPGATGKVLDAISSGRTTVLRSEDVASMLQAATTEDVRPRLERFSLDRLDRVLDAHRGER